MNCAVFGPDSHTVFTGCREFGNLVLHWDAATGRSIEPAYQTGAPHSHGSKVFGVGISPDGSVVYTGDHKQQIVHFWDAATARRIGGTQPHGAEGSRLAMSLDGKKLAVSGANSVRLWSIETGQPIGRRMQHQGGVYALAFRPDARMLLTGSTDRTTRLWDASTGEPHGEPIHHRDEVNAVCFSPDGGAIVTGGADGNVQRWDAANWKPVGRPMQHQGAVQSVAYLTGGRLILTVSHDGAGAALARSHRFARWPGASTRQPCGLRPRQPGRSNPCHLWRRLAGPTVVCTGFRVRRSVRRPACGRANDGSGTG